MAVFISISLVRTISLFKRRRLMSFLLAPVEMKFFQSIFLAVTSVLGPYPGTAAILTNLKYTTGK